MSRPDDIIPIASRRPAHSRGVMPEVGKRKPPAGGLALLLIVLGLVATGLLFAFAESRPQRAIAHLPGPYRTALFRRAYDELRATCRLPEAADDVVHERCRNTAWFVLLFPECDQACGEAARALLPHARR
jgi:hypothetical protein